MHEFNVNNRYHTIKCNLSFNKNILSKTNKILRYLTLSFRNPQSSFIRNTFKTKYSVIILAAELFCEVNCKHRWKLCLF